MALPLSIKTMQDDPLKVKPGIRLGNKCGFDDFKHGMDFGARHAGWSECFRNC